MHNMKYFKTILFFSWHVSFFSITCISAVKYCGQLKVLPPPHLLTPCSSFQFLHNASRSSFCCSTGIKLSAVTQLLQRGVFIVWAMHTILGRGLSHLPQAEEPCKKDSNQSLLLVQYPKSWRGHLLRLVRWNVFVFPNEGLHLLVRIQGRRVIVLLTDAKRPSSIRSEKPEFRVTGCQK